MADFFEVTQAMPLEKVCDMFTGIPVSPKQFEPMGEIQVISLKDTDTQFNLFIENFGRANIKVKEDKFLEQGDVLLKSRSHDFNAITIARTYPAPEMRRLVIAGPGFIVMRPHNRKLGVEIVTPAYLAWIMNNMTAELGKLVSGSAILQLNIKTLAGLVIPIPTIEEQDKIIATQNEVDAAREVAAAYFAKIEDLMVGKLKSAIRAN